MGKIAEGTEFKQVLAEGPVQVASYGDGEVRLLVPNVRQRHGVNVGLVLERSEARDVVAAIRRLLKEAA